MKYLKLTQQGYENYSGPLGRYEFKDGISVEMLHRVDRDRLGNSFQLDEIDENGNRQEAGVAARLVRETTMVAHVDAGLPVQTEEERAAELAGLLKDTVRDDKGVILLSFEDLSKIADRQGINGLRRVAEPWNVKSRSIPDLMNLILEAQKVYQEGRQARMEASAAIEVAATEAMQPVKTEEGAPVTYKEPDITPPVDAAVLQSDVDAAEAAAGAEAAAIAAAAMTGDLSAALKE